MYTSIGIMFGLFFLLFMLLVYNIVQYVIRQRRYKIFHIMWFYIFAMTVVVLRCLCYIMLIKYLITLQNAEGPTKHVTHNIDVIDNFAAFFELILGVQQLCSVMELTQMVTLSSLTKSADCVEQICEKEDKILKKLRLTRIFLLVFSVLLVLVCVSLTFYDKYDQARIQTYQLWFSAIATPLFGLVCLFLVIQLFKF